MTDAIQILKSGEKFAQAEGTKAAEEHKTHTALTFEGEKSQAGPGSITIGLETKHEGEHVTITAGGWFKRVFQPGGSSAGVKGKIEFGN